MSKRESITFHDSKLIEALGLNEFEETLAGSLSGGNKRKLSVALALIGGS